MYIFNSELNVSFLGRVSKEPTLNMAYAVRAFPLWEFFRMSTTLSGNPMTSRKGMTFTPLKKKHII